MEFVDYTKNSLKQKKKILIPRNKYNFLSLLFYFVDSAAVEKVLVYIAVEINDKVCKLIVAESDMRGAKVAAGDISRKMQIIIGKFNNNVMNHAKQISSDGVINGLMESF